jgi:DNA-directed RNA polymerase subunit E'/Rpb7
VTPDAEARQAVVRHLIVFRPFAGEVIRAPAKNGIKLNVTALPALDC